MTALLWKRSVLAAAAALAVGAGAARAQDLETVRPSVLDPAKPHPILHLLHLQPPVGCWATHNGYSCDSWRAENIFLFGSCRAFYGEPCIKGPPPPPWSPDADIPPRRGAAGVPSGAAQAPWEPDADDSPHCNCP